MAIKEGDFVRLNFTGKIKETDEVFDTTSEDIAEEAGILVENKVYGPIPIIVGGNHLLKAIDDAIIGTEAGEAVHVSVTPENGFGQRNPNFIQLIPMKEFKKQGMTPVRGMKITADAGLIINRTSQDIFCTFHIFYYFCANERQDYGLY